MAHLSAAAATTFCPAALCWSSERCGWSGGAAAIAALLLSLTPCLLHLFLSLGRAQPCWGRRREAGGRAGSEVLAKSEARSVNVLASLSMSRDCEGVGRAGTCKEHLQRLLRRLLLTSTRPGGITLR